MKIPAELERFKLEHAVRQVKRRLVLTAEGGPGVGKTDLFYRTAPRPALVIQLDLNDEGLRERYTDDPDIVFKNIVVPPTAPVREEKHRQADMKLYTELRDLYRLSMEKGYFRSIMIDEGLALYELVRRAFLVGLGFGESPQQSYTPVNAAMARFFTFAKQCRGNLYIPHRQTDEREDGVSSTGKKTSTPTGRKKAAGWKHSLYESQCHILLEKDDTVDPRACAECGMRKKTSTNTLKYCTCDKFVKQDPLAKFTATVKKCTANTKIEGRVFTGAEIDWVQIGLSVFPHSSPEEWE